MFDTICQMIPIDPDYSERARRLEILRRVLDGKLYDVMAYEFQDERSSGGEYIPLRSRKPSVRYNLCRVVVEDSVSLLFGDAHFPTIESDDPAVTALCTKIVSDTRLTQVMTEAALRGSVGSVAILMRILETKLYFTVLDTTYLTPRWDPMRPGVLLGVTERYKVLGSDLVAQGYDISDPLALHWFERSWDATGEYWQVPYAVGQPKPDPALDLSRSVEHRLGFVPIIWIKNLPGGDQTDGACTFRPAVETSIEIDYQLSQAGRGLKYSSDPTLLIKEPAMSGQEIIKGAGNALIVSEKGDARLLEIGGTAAAAVIDYVRTLREFALESIHGNRSDASRLSAAASGRALELMQQGLVWLANNLRVSYGEAGILPLMQMVLRAAQRIRLTISNKPVLGISPEAQLSLKWPHWTTSTADDRLKDAQALSALAAANQISRATAVRAVADTYHIVNPLAELAEIARYEENK
ncbi:MAG: phage portal protein [Acidocella sp.]|nr:phage portal protein [Acidocella sp.]